MKSARTVALIVLAIGIALNEWAFRFFIPQEPVDSFIRLMMLVFDGFLLVFVGAFLKSNSTFSERLTELLHQWPRSLTMFLGLFLAYCGMMAVEFGCRFYFKAFYEAPYSEHTYWEPCAVVADAALGSSLPPDTVIGHALVVNDSLIYKKYYRTDTFGRHMTPTTDSAQAEFVMVTGCSFAFGYAVDEDETLSYYLDSLTGLRGYNYGVSGHGTQQTLALLQSRDMHNEITEPNGVLIHLFIDRHIQRLIGSRRLIKLWASHYPYYHLDGEALKRDGSFLTGRPLLTRFYRIISQSAFIDLFDIDFPWYVSNGHLNLFGAVMQEAEREFRRQYPDGRFLVVIAPNSELAPRIKAVLEKNRIELLDCSGLLDMEEKQYKVHWTEGHPNGLYYRKMAEAIKRHLNHAQR